MPYYIRTSKYIKLFFSIDDVFVCTHNKFDKCHCRKPKIGMIKLAEKKWNLDLKESGSSISGHICNRDANIDILKSGVVK